MFVDALGALEHQAGPTPLILWANLSLGEDLLAPIRTSMLAWGAEAGVPVVDLLAVYDAQPATAEEQRWYAEHAPFHAFNGIEPGDEGYPMGRLALQTDWFHPNRFGHERLAEALLPHVEAALDYRAESSSSPAESSSSPAESSSSPAESSSSPAESSSSPAESSSSPSDG